MNAADTPLCSINQRKLSGIFSASLCAAIIASFFLASGLQAQAQQTATRDFSKETARSSRPWVRDGVIYEIFPRV
ncbi:MAG TPA: hypothetical protein VF766_10465, partial [Pyrinomonadaceae bacterium]